MSNRVKQLINSYARFIAIPWRDDAAAAQRVIFCVYNQADELRLQPRIDEFELCTRNVGHGWVGFDLTDTFADWLEGQRYAPKYFQQPQLLATLMPKYQDFIVERLRIAISAAGIDAHSVVALRGVGSLFGFLKVKGVVDAVASMVPGRLVVFFPGSYDNDNYRLLDGYDGWNYLAVPITADKEA